MKPYLVNSLAGAIRANATAADKLSVHEQVHRPILKIVRFHSRDFELQALRDLRFGKRAAEKSRYSEIAPKFAGQRQIFRGPVAESQPLALQEIKRGVHGREYSSKNILRRSTRL